MSSEAMTVTSTNVDIDKLLVSVQNQPAIYNTALKDHHNVNVINTIWTEIGKELDVPGYVCKAKWGVLRNSFTRHLRQLRRMKRGSAQKKKKWYLADAMEFLQPFTTFSEQKERQEDDLPPSKDSLELSTDARCKKTPRKKVKKTSADIVVGPMINFLKTDTERILQETPKQIDSAIMCFFKSLLPDVESLSVRRQRQFKTMVMATLNDLIDEEENSAQCSPSTYSASDSSHLFPDDPQVRDEGDTSTYHNLY